MKPLTRKRPAETASRVRCRELLDALVAAVNAARYRGPDRQGPMTDSYGWPMHYDRADAITTAALRYVVAIESASNAPAHRPAREEPKP